MKNTKNNVQKYSVNISKNAEDDLNEIVLYIAQNDGYNNALRILQLFEDAITTLETFPEKYRRVPELLEKNIKEYREIVKDPWRIIYRIENHEAEIITVIDGRRNVQDILTRKLIK